MAKGGATPPKPGFAGPPKVVARRIVIAANQLDLCQRVENGAGRFVKLNRAAHLECAVQRVGGARQVAEAHADLADRRERHGEPVA